MGVQQGVAWVESWARAAGGTPACPTPVPAKRDGTGGAAESQEAGQHTRDYCLPSQ